MLLQELTGIKSQKGKTATEVLQILKKEYGITVNHGLYGVVLTHPSWNYVLKFFGKDDCYLQFVDFCRKNKSKNLPIFKRPPIQMSVFFKNSYKQTIEVGFLEKLEKFYAVKIEKLDKLSYGEEQDVANTVGKEVFLNKYKKVRGTPEEAEFLRSYDSDIDFNEYKDLIEITLKLSDEMKGSCALDLHDENVMKRGDDLVIIDPYATYTDDEEIFNITKIFSWTDLKNLSGQESSEGPTPAQTAAMIAKI